MQYNNKLLFKKTNMGYLTFCICVFLSLIALWRIIRTPYHWLTKTGYVVLALIPFVGPIFYLIIDPPASTPSGVSKEDFHASSGKGSGNVVPSYDRLLKSFGHWFK
jgi:hypothetical protein